jgi:ribosomal protein S17E
MGRVKQLMVKKAARELHESVPELSDNFEHNKKLLKNVMHFKSVRNKVAGGIVALIKKERLKEQKRNSKNIGKDDDRGTTEE